MVVVGIMGIIVLGMYSLFTLSIAISTENKMQVSATEIANQKIETIRNMAYDDVGTISGIPAGLIPEFETVDKGASFSIHHTVVFHDDPFDGTLDLGTDAVFTDYKIVTVEVSWNGSFGNKKIAVFSKIIPQTEETNAGYGLLKIFTVDANGAPLAGASINVVNNSLVPTVNVTYTSNAAGFFSIPALPAMESYEISVSKAGYSTDKTYGRTADNPNPTKVHLSAFLGAKTEESFAIDTLGNLSINTVSGALPDNYLASPINSDNHNIPAVAFLDNESRLIAWQSENATSSAILLQGFDSAHNKVWANDISLSSSVKPSNPDLSVASGGPIFVTWEDKAIDLKALARNNQGGTKISQRKNHQSDSKNKIKENNFTWPHNISHIWQKTSHYISQLSTSWRKSFSNIFKDKTAQAGTTAVSYIGIARNNNTSGNNSIVVSRPAGTQIGDLLVAIGINDDYDDGVVKPVGSTWNTATSTLRPNNDNNRTAIYWRFVAAGEPGSYTFNTTVSDNKAIHIIAFRNVDPLNPLSAFNYQTNDTISVPSRNISAPSIDVAIAGSMLLAYWGSDNDRIGEPSSYPAGMSNGNASDGNNIGMATAIQSMGSIGATGNKVYRSVQNVSSDNAIGVTLLINPLSTPDIDVSSTGTQSSQLLINQNSQYLGGVFIIKGLVGSHSLSSVKLKNNGTLFAQDGIEDVHLYFDVDNTAPYDCADQSYAGGDTLFGTGDFAADQTAVITNAGQTINTTRSLCLYPMLDINTTVNVGDTFDLSIANPSADLIAGAAIITPATPVDISAISTLHKAAKVIQTHFIVRHDDGDEINASNVAAQDSPAEINHDENIRLRFGIKNDGSLDTSAIKPKLEYAEKNGTCSDISNTWRDFSYANSAWSMTISPHIGDAAATQDVAGLLSDENSIFVAGQFKENDFLADSDIILGNDTFSEYEFSIKNTLNLDPSKSYCFRLSNANGGSVYYDRYPEIRVIGDSNIYVKILAQDGTVIAGPRRVNLNNDSSEQTNARSAVYASTSGTWLAVAWEDNRGGQSDIYWQRINQAGDKLLASDMAIAATADEERDVEISTCPNEDMLAIWRVNSGGSESFQVRRFDKDGTPIWSSAVQIPGLSASGRASLVCGDSLSHLAWTGEESGAQTAKLGALDNSGNIAWTKVAPRDTSAGPCRQASLASSNDRLVLTWTDLRASQEDIYAQKFDFSGNPQWSNDQKLNISIDIQPQDSASLGVSHSGQFFAAWSDKRSGLRQIYATDINDPGLKTNIANVPIRLYSTKRIGESPILYKEDRTFYTNASGNYSLPLEWESAGYQLDIVTASTTLNIINRDPSTPLKIKPGESRSIEVYVQ